MFTTQKQVRAAFWQGNEQFQAEYKSSKRQNAYNATIRSEFVQFVDMLARDNHITAALANRVTL